MTQDFSDSVSIFTDVNVTFRFHYGKFHQFDFIFQHCVLSTHFASPSLSVTHTQKSKDWLKTPSATGSHMRMTQLAHSETLYFVFGFEWEGQLPGTPGIGCWHRCINGLLAPHSAATETSWHRVAMRHLTRGEKQVNYDDEEQRSTMRELDRSMWAETHVTASSGGWTQPLPCSFPTAHNGYNKDSINYAEHNPPFCVLVSTETSFFFFPPPQLYFQTKCYWHSVGSMLS